MARLFLLIFALCICLVACGDMSPTSNPTVQPAVQPTKTILPTPQTVVPTIPKTTAPPITPSSSQDEDDMREALLRYNFGQITIASYPDSKYYCLGFETTRQSPSNLQDPPQALLNRFQGNNPPVVKASECDMVGENMDSRKVVLKSSGEQAIFWGLGNINWSGKDKAELELSYLYAFNGTGGSIFQLERQNGTWQVTGYTMTWIA